MLRLGLPDPRGPRPASGWGTVTALARLVLREVTVPPAPADPLWDVLAELHHGSGSSGASERGRDVGAPGVRLGPHARAARRLLAQAGIPAEAFAVPGYLCRTRTHLDVLLPLARVDIRVRRAGLDVDPGWVPSLRRIIAFRFDDGPQPATRGRDAPDVPPARDLP